jgi:hypothetical protein
MDDARRRKIEHARSKTIFHARAGEGPMNARPASNPPPVRDFEDPTGSDIASRVRELPPQCAVAHPAFAGAALVCWRQDRFSDAFGHRTLGRSGR